MNNIKFICEQVLSKNKNLQDFSGENVSNKFKKLLGYLGVNSELIDELTLDLSKEKINLSNEFSEFDAAPLCNDETNKKTASNLSKEKITLSEKTKVIAPLEQDNNSEVGLIQQILSAIKKFFGFDDREAAIPVSVETNNDDETRRFFSKPGMGDFKNKNYSAPLCVQQNGDLVK